MRWGDLVFIHAYFEVKSVLTRVTSKLDVVELSRCGSSLVYVEARACIFFCRLPAEY
jgi:hypothetical protein